MSKTNLSTATVSQPPVKIRVSQPGGFLQGSLGLVVRRILAGGSLVLLLASPAWCEPKAAAAKGSSGADKPIVTVAVSSVDQLYDDLKFVFQLADDDKGYKTFKETLDSFVMGVETDKPCGWRVYRTTDGLHTVASVPVKDEASVKKLRHNLWDLDVKTAPPPTPAQISHVSRPIQEKVRSLKLQPNEWIVFGLADGFMRYESGYLHIGESLEDVRLSTGGIPAAAAKGATVSLQVDGESATPAQRRDAFDKSKAKFLEGMKKIDRETDAEFALGKAVVELQLAKLELIFADALHVDLGWTTSHESKKSKLTARVTPVPDTPLAKDIEQMGQLSDVFAGVSKQGAVLSSSINIPNDQTFTKSLKSVSHQARIVVRNEIKQHKELNAEQKSVDQQFLDLVCDLVDDVAAMPVFNGFARTWANSDGSLTTVGAVKVADGAKYREAVRKFKAQERVADKSASGGVEIHKIAVAKWQKDLPELFEKDGAIYLGTSAKAVWYAFGEKGLERLEQAIQEAGSGQAKSPIAVELHAELLPLAKVWDRYCANHPESTRAKSKTADVKSTETGKATAKSNTGDKSTAKASAEKKSPEKGKHKAFLEAKSTVTDLELQKIAVEAFQKGHDTISITLTHKEKSVDLDIQSDEGILRFIGLALSKFTKDNLE